MRFLFNDKGGLLGVVGKRSYAFVSPKRRTSVATTPDYKFSVDINGRPTEFVMWGDNNIFPEDANDRIGENNVLQTGLDFKVRVAFGQGIVPCRLTGMTEDGEEQFEVVNDVKLLGMLRGYMTRNMVLGSLRDLYKFGNAFVVMTLNSDGSEILNVETLNARHCRVSKNKRWVALFPDYAKYNPSLDTKGLRVVPMLDEFDPWTDLMMLKEGGRLGNGGIRQVCFPRLKNYFSNNDYYGMPNWWSAVKSGWLDVAAKVPAFLKYAYANAMSMMWHVTIPSSFFDEKFPEMDYLNRVDERKRDIEAWYEQFEESLCGEENAFKTFMTTYASEPGMGKGSDRIEITRLKNEIEAKEQLTTSAAANSEILFSLMVNPSVMGAGMPGGSYAGNAGSGSDIRESALISIVLAHIEKEQVLDPLEMMLRYNGWEDVELRFRRTILTTLNTGNSVEEGIS